MGKTILIIFKPIFWFISSIKLNLFSNNGFVEITWDSSRNCRNVIIICQWNPVNHKLMRSWTNTPEIQHSGRRSSPYAWRRTLSGSSDWGHFPPGRRGCRDCCHEAVSELDRAAPWADTEHYSMLPSLPRCGWHGKRCFACWMWYSALCGWCGGGNSAPPKEADDRVRGIEVYARKNSQMHHAGERRCNVNLLTERNKVIEKTSV